MKKERAEDLAVFGAAPAFQEILHVGRPNIGDRERLISRINGILDRRWLTNDGPLVREFEARVAEIVGARHCIAVSSATSGLEIVIRALGLEGEVILPAFTFIATAHVLEWLRITPIFCDIDEAYGIDPEMVEKLITLRTTGIIGVHVWGRPCNIAALAEIARNRGLAVVFDAAHAFWCSAGGRMIGNFGAAEVFSFHATKFVNSFEGGAIATNDDDLAVRLRRMRNFGFAGQDTVVGLGINGKMSEVNAAMGLTSLESLDHFIGTNRCNYDRYRTGLADLPGLSLMEYDRTERRNYQYVVLEIGEGSDLRRDDLMRILWAENIHARRYFHPGCHRSEPYLYRYQPLPETERLCGRVLSLPTGTAIDPSAIDKICGIIRCALRNAAEIRQRMKEAA